MTSFSLPLSNPRPSLLLLGDVILHFHGDSHGLLRVPVLQEESPQLRRRAGAHRRGRGPVSTRLEPIVLHSAAVAADAAATADAAAAVAVAAAAVVASVLFCLFCFIFSCVRYNFLCYH